MSGRPVIYARPCISKVGPMGPISDPGICPDKSAQPGDLILEFTHFLTRMDILKEIKYLYILFWLIYNLVIQSQLVLFMVPRNCGFIKLNQGLSKLVGDSPPGSWGLIPG